MPLIFSIAPRWVEAILTKEKRFELRRRGPRIAPPGTSALIYSTAPVSALVGRFVIGEIDRAAPSDLWARVGNQSALTRDEFDQYFSGCQLGHAIEIREPVRLSDPLTYKEIRNQFQVVPPRSWMSIDDSHPLQEALR